MESDRIFSFQITGFISLAVVLISTLTFVLETLPYFDKENSEYPICVIILEVIDQAAVIFFTIEYVVRFMCSPRKWPFVKDTMNIIDVLAIMPVYIGLALDQLEDLKIIGNAARTIRLVRILRIIRVFKLLRHFTFNGHDF